MDEKKYISKLHINDEDYYIAPHSTGGVISINGQKGNVTLSAVDVSALPDTITPILTVNNKSGNTISLSAVDVGALPNTIVPVLTVNSKSGNNINLSARDVSAATLSFNNNFIISSNTNTSDIIPVLQVNEKTGNIISLVKEDIPGCSDENIQAIAAQNWTLVWENTSYLDTISTQASLAYGASEISDFVTSPSNFELFAIEMCDFSNMYSSVSLSSFFGSGYSNLPEDFKTGNIQSFSTVLGFKNKLINLKVCTYTSSHNTGMRPVLITNNKIFIGQNRYNGEWANAWNVPTRIYGIKNTFVTNTVNSTA